MRTRPNYTVPLILSGLVGGIGTFLAGLNWSFLLAILLAPVGGSLCCLATAFYLFSVRARRAARTGSGVETGVVDASTADGRSAGARR